MKIVNGRWVNQQGERLTTPEEHNAFQDTLTRVKLFARGKALTNSKVQLLFNILSTDDDKDNALTSILYMDNAQLKRLF